MTESIAKNQKINIFINNNPEWGGTYQYTQLIIKAVEEKFNKENINFYYTNNIWNEERKRNYHFMNLNVIQLIFSQLLILFNFIKIPKSIIKFFLPSLPNTFFEKNQYWIFPSQDIISTICNGKTIVSINDLMHRYSNFSETSSLFRKL